MRETVGIFIINLKHFWMNWRMKVLMMARQGLLSCEALFLV